MIHSFLGRHCMCVIISLLIFVPVILPEANTALAQSPAWIWAKSSQGHTAGSDHGTSITTDRYGNVYVTGFFLNQTITFEDHTLNTSGGYDLFLVKYASDGMVLWAQKIGGDGDEAGLGVTTDPIGNVYVAGHFSSSVLSIGASDLINGGETDLLIVKYDPAGNLLWANSAGGSAADAGHGVTTDANGNVYFVGNFQSSELSIGDTVLYNSGGSDIFIAKYSTTGDFIWAKHAGGVLDDQANAIAADIFGNIFITGEFVSPALDFGTNMLINTGGRDVFTAKFDQDGHCLWAKQSAGIQNEFASSVSTDAQGNAYITGDFTSDTVDWEGSFLYKTGMHSPFIVKYNWSGEVIWAQSPVCTGGENRAYSISSDASGNVYIAGGFSTGTMIFGTDSLHNEGWSNVFVAKYNTEGEALWAKRAGGAKLDLAYGIALDVAGDAFVTGYFYSNPSNFDTIPLYKADHTGFNVFVARVGEQPTGIATNINPNRLYIYPNPGNGRFTIDGPLMKVKNVSISNLMGKTIYVSEVSHLPHNIELYGQPEGVYLLRLQTENGILVERLLLTR